MGYWTLCAHIFFNHHQEVNQQNVSHFYANWQPKTADNVKKSFKNLKFAYWTSKIAVQNF